MANIHLVTGYSGKAHVTAADHGSFNAAIFGDGQYVLDRGKKLAASLVSNNQVRISDGDILMNGRHIRLDSASYTDLTIENGATGYNRNDLIVCRYTKNATSGAEECNLVVIKGTATTGTAADPTYSTGSIINGVSQADFPLYRIPVCGLAVGTPEQLFEVAYPQVSKNPRIEALDSGYIDITDEDDGKVIVVNASSKAWVYVPKGFTGMEVTILRIGSGTVGVTPGTDAYFFIHGQSGGLGEGSRLACYIPEINGSITLKCYAPGNWFIAQGSYTTGYDL